MDTVQLMDANKRVPEMPENARNIIFNLTTHTRCFCTCCIDNILKMDMAQENVDKLLMMPDRACDMEQTPALKQHNVLKNFLNTVRVM